MLDQIKEVQNESRDINAETSKMLWAVSAGICEFRGCCNKLYTHHVTKENINLSEKAHIYAFSKGGRRFSRLLTRSKINDIDNLMLVCESCHKLIDSKDINYSAENLLEMKKEHEQRIELLTGIKPDLQSEIIIYNCNIANRSIKVSEFTAMINIVPEYYPARNNPINISPDLNLFDNECDFWNVMSRDLERKLELYEPSVRDKHISLFAIAPQPLLFKLGTLLNRNYNVDVRQSQTDISDWKWKNKSRSIEIELEDNAETIKTNNVVLTVDITAGIPKEQIQTVFGICNIYSIKAVKYDSKAIKCKEDLNAVIALYREALNIIRLNHPQDVHISLVPVAPASVSIEMGRQWMKGDPNITVYDRNYITKEIKSAISFEI